MRTKKTTNKKTSAKSDNSKNNGLSSLIAEFKGAIDRQTETFMMAIEGLKKGLSRQKPLRATGKTEEKLSTKRERSPQSEVINGDKMFIDTLRQIGRPSTTREIAQRLKKIDPAVKKIARNKEKFMQLLYTAASHLSKEGVVKRNQVGHRMYEYALKDWSKPGSKTGSNTIPTTRKKRKYSRRAA